VMYFNAQRARIPGLETTSHGWVSTYTLSQKAGRVNMGKCVHCKLSQPRGSVQLAKTISSARTWSSGRWCRGSHRVVRDL